MCSQTTLPMEALCAGVYTKRSTRDGWRHILYFVKVVCTKSVTATLSWRTSKSQLPSPAHTKLVSYTFSSRRSFSKFLKLLPATSEPSRNLHSYGLGLLEPEQSIQSNTMILYEVGFVGEEPIHWIIWLIALSNIWILWFSGIYAPWANGVENVMLLCLRVGCGWRRMAALLIPLWMTLWTPASGRMVEFWEHDVVMD